jgi:hypothetical protein
MPAFLGNHVIPNISIARSSGQVHHRLLWIIQLVRIEWNVAELHAEERAQRLRIRKKPSLNSSHGHAGER